MTLTDTLHVLLGAALVAIGVLAAALSDRIRGLRVSREATPRDRANRTPLTPVPPVHTDRTVIPVVDGLLPTPPRPSAVPAKTRADRAGSKGNEDGGDDVIAALMAAGYKKPTASEATWACTSTERTTVESWTAAALRRCARGGLS